MVRNQEGSKIVCHSRSSPIHSSRLVLVHTYFHRFTSTKFTVHVASGFSPSERLPWDGQVQPIPQQHHDRQTRWSPMPPTPTKGLVKYRQSPYPICRGPRHNGQLLPIDTSHLLSWLQGHMQQQHIQSLHSRPKDTAASEASNCKSLSPNAAPLNTKPLASAYSPPGIRQRDSAVEFAERRNDFRRHKVGSLPFGPEYQPSRSEELQRLTTTFPWESQQILAGSPYSPNFSFYPQPIDMVPQSPVNYRYSYNPNWRPDNKPRLPDLVHATAVCAAGDVSVDQPHPHKLIAQQL